LALVVLNVARGLGQPAEAEAGQGGGG